MTDTRHILQAYLIPASLKGAVKAPTALSGFSPYNRFTCSKAPRHSLQLWPNSPSQFSIKKTPR
jgi:hypothetical protein